METIIKFEEGKTYATPAPGDSEMMVTVTVEKRTAKRLTFMYHGKSKTVGISIYKGVEQINPWGRSSMCPVIGANEEVKPKDISQVVLQSTGDTLESLFEEGKKLFSPEQMTNIKMGLAELLMDEAFTVQKPTAKIYNMADYRR
jgi:hypothetical protein